MTTITDNELHRRLGEDPVYAAFVYGWYGATDLHLWRNRENLTFESAWEMFRTTRDAIEKAVAERESPVVPE